MLSKCTSVAGGCKKVLQDAAAQLSQQGRLCLDIGCTTSSRPRLDITGFQLSVVKALIGLTSQFRHLAERQCMG